MKALLVFDIPNEYADRYNVKEMYVWSMAVHDKQGYQMFDLTTDEPSHLKPLPETKDVGYPIDDYAVGFGDGWDACLKEITK